MQKRYNGGGQGELARRSDNLGKGRGKVGKGRSYISLQKSNGGGGGGGGGRSTIQFMGSCRAIWGARGWAVGLSGFCQKFTHNFMLFGIAMIFSPIMPTFMPKYCTLGSISTGTCN